jgi:dimethylamine monooxygenase subunit A
VFAGLTASQLLVRSNWSLLDSGDLHQPASTHAMAADATFSAELIGQKIWVRTERQTLRRLPRTEAILFTIRVFQCRLDELDDSHHEPLLRALSNLSDNAVQYKHVAPMRPAITQWLSSH